MQVVVNLCYPRKIFIKWSNEEKPRILSARGEKGLCSLLARQGQQIVAESYASPLSHNLRACWAFVFFVPSALF